MIAPRAVSSTHEEPMQADLGWLDLLIHREILRLRATYQLSLDEFRGLYVSDEQVDALVQAPLQDMSGQSIDFEAALGGMKGERCASSALVHLSQEFSLSCLEQDLLLVAAAPELDPKYETLYGYLNNDVSRKAATMDLMCRLLVNGEQSKRSIRTALQPHAPLFASGLLQLAAGSDRGARLSACVLAHRSVSAFLLNLDLKKSGPAELAALAQLPERSEFLAPTLRTRLAVTSRAWRRGTTAPIWILHGRDTELRHHAALRLSANLDLTLLQLDLATLAPNAEALAAALRGALMQQRLLDAALRITGVERYRDADGRLTPDLVRALRSLREARRPVFLEADELAALKNALDAFHVIEIEVPELSRAERAAVWASALCARGVQATPQAVEQVTNCFALTVLQIESAAQSLADEGDSELADPQPLADAARRASDHSLASIAQRLERCFDLKEVVLPSTTFGRLQDVVHAIRNRHLVFGDWGLSARAGGSGLRVLFSGPSGTGKTMAAAALARELGVDVYRIDISQTVSKYIGETEKNLDKIFRAALYSNAILFFDEADALFGKRSEVKDAHDRYSNIETAYLLQKIEEYSGIVLLASNLSRNIDSAFSRRLNFVLEFPLPDKADRERLWRGMLAGTVPVASDLDIGFLAAQFPLTGGEIRNVVLDAAFSAAQGERRALTMKHVVIALGRQLAKQGRVPSITEFKQHHELLTER
jgi:hypothetical protein